MLCMTFRGCLCIFFLFCLAVPVAAQEFSTNKKANQLYGQAREVCREKDYEKALSLLDKASGLDNTFAELYFLRADIYKKLGDDDRETEAMQEGLARDSVKYTSYYYFLGDKYIGRGDYALALGCYDRYLKWDKKRIYALQAGQQRENCLFALNALETGKRRPVELYLEAENSVYWPSWDMTGQTILYTALNAGVENIWMRREGGDVLLNLNSWHNEGTQSLTADGRMMYFTGCNRPDSRGSCDIYVAYRLSDTSWSDPVNLGFPVNTNAWEAQPSVSTDGTRLFFASNRGGGKGKSDIWYSVLLQTGEDGKQIWSEPRNLKINTPGDEMAPFLYYDNKTLFFASNGYPGMGGIDIYKVPLDGAGVPENIGVTVNTYKNEMGFAVDASGKYGYFSSDMDGRKRIYRYQLEGTLICDEMAYVQISVQDERGLPLSPDNLVVVNLAADDTLAFYDKAYASPRMLSCVPANSMLLISAIKAGYMYYSDTLQIGQADYQHPLHKEIVLSPVRSGESLVLKGVFFDLDAHSLKPESGVELDRLVAFLKLNPEVEIEISGHTDDTGTDEHNNRLSEDRAFEVYKYLFLHRIGKERMSYRGYGKSQPIAPNDSESGRAKNRRTEIRIK